MLIFHCKYWWKMEHKRYKLDNWRRHRLTRNLNTAHTYYYCFFKPSKGNVNVCIYNTKSLKYPQLQKLIDNLHAFTGCDTKSCFFKQGKNQIIKIFLNDVVLQQKANYFYNHTLNPVLAPSSNDISSRMCSSKKDKESRHEHT